MASSLSARVAWSVAFVFVIGWPLLTIRESLWIDELHSLWAISGEWDEVAERAAIGNQSPLYYWVLKGWCQGWTWLSLGNIPADLAARSLSWVGWVVFVRGVFASLARRQDSLHRESLLAITVAWLTIDRIGGFYALEVRPYGWLAATSLFLMREGSARRAVGGTIAWPWIVAAIFAFYLHYTAVFAVALSGLALFLQRLVIASRRPNSFRLRAVIPTSLEAGFWLIAVAPGVRQLFQLAPRSDQWSAFAGNHSWTATIDLLPWIAWGIIPGLVWWIDGGRQSHEPSPVPTPSRLKPTTTGSLSSILPARREWLISWPQLLLVGGGSVVAVWCLTSVGVAPLMHRRYIIAAYPAFLLLGLLFLSQTHCRRWWWVGSIASLLFLGWWQGTYREWTHGRWIPWQRTEDWRSVSALLRREAANDEPIWMAPMLIETAGKELDPHLSLDYLLSPLTTVYAIPHHTLVGALPNLPDNWWGLEGQQLALHNKSRGWLVVRTTRQSWEEFFRVSIEQRRDLAGFWKYRPVLDGGRVQVIAIERNSE